MEIKDRLFYVTGGCSGLGVAVVDELVNRGGWPRVMVHSCDVCSESQVVAGLRKATKAWPDKLIGGLVHCAGVGAIDRTLNAHGEPGNLAAFRAVIEINLTGTYNVARLVASEIARQNGRPSSEQAMEEQGVIILTSSTSWQDGQKGQVGYAASKGGVASMVLPMARDLGKFGIRVVAIAPSLFQTPMASKLPPATIKNLLQTVEFPLRLGSAAEFSSLVVECIRNTYLNGTIIRLDAAGRMGKL